MCFESLSKFQLYIGWRGLMCQVSKSLGSRLRNRVLGELSKLGGGGGRGLRMVFWELLIRENKKTWSEDGSNLHHGASSRGQSLNLYLKSYNPSSHLPPNKPFLSNTNTPWIVYCVRWLTSELHTTQTQTQTPPESSCVSSCPMTQLRVARYAKYSAGSTYCCSGGKHGIELLSAQLWDRCWGLFHHQQLWARSRWIISPQQLWDKCWWLLHHKQLWYWCTDVGVISPPIIITGFALKHYHNILVGIHWIQERCQTQEKLHQVGAKETYLNISPRVQTNTTFMLFWSWLKCKL